MLLVNKVAVTIGNVIIKVDKVLEKIQPEAMLVLGDTNSCMAVLPAKRRKIPTFTWRPVIAVLSACPRGNKSPFS